jgi:hypothetical protein
MKAAVDAAHALGKRIAIDSYGPAGKENVFTDHGVEQYSYQNRTRSANCTIRGELTVVETTPNDAGLDTALPGFPKFG